MFNIRDKIYTKNYNIGFVTFAERFCFEGLSFTMINKKFIMYIFFINVIGKNIHKINYQFFVTALLFVKHYDIFQLYSKRNIGMIDTFSSCLIFSRYSIHCHVEISLDDPFFRTMAYQRSRPTYPRCI